MSDQDWQHDPEPTRSPFADLQRQLEETREKLEAARGEARTWRDVGSAIAFERNAERARADEECARADGFSALAKMLEVDLKKERARAEWAERNTVLQEQLTRDARDERDAAIQRAERAEAREVEVHKTASQLLAQRDTLRRKGEGLATALKALCTETNYLGEYSEGELMKQAALADWEKP